MDDHHVDRRAGPAAAHSGRGADAALVRQRPCRDGKIVMAKVTLQGVKKNYGPVRAIHGIDMEIADGEFIVIVGRSEEHTSELQSLMRISYAVFCLKKNT